MHSHGSKWDSCWNWAVMVTSICVLHWALLELLFLRVSQVRFPVEADGKKNYYNTNKNCFFFKWDKIKLNMKYKEILYKCYKTATKELIHQNRQDSGPSFVTAPASAQVLVPNNQQGSCLIGSFLECSLRTREVQVRFPTGIWHLWDL